MTTASISIDCSLQDSHFEDIVTTAGLVMHWADEADIEFVDEDGDALLYRIQETEGRQFVITKPDLEAAIRDTLEGKLKAPSSLHESLTGFLFDKDQGDLDAQDADTLIQLACFGEVIYA